MGGQNRVIVLLLGVFAALVIVIGGLSAVLLAAGGDDGDDEAASSGGGGGVTTDSGGDDGGSSGGRLRLAGTDPVTLDPALATDSGSAEYIVEIFGGLTTITPPRNSASSSTSPSP